MFPWATAMVGEAMPLTAVADAVPFPSEVMGGEAVVSGISHDSNAIEPGDLFVAIRGMRTDGHRFVDGALARGATAIAVERPLPVDAPQVVVPDTRAALAWMAAAIFGDPSRRLDVVGVTGTNGKTTVTHLLEAITTAAGMVPGIVGTVGARVAGARVEVPRTTPEAGDLQRLLSSMVDAGVDLAAIEVSSHALSLHRVDAIWFRIVAFTNLTQDHLDFHGELEEYFAVKRTLFDPDRAEQAVIMVDDEAGRAIADTAELPVTTVSTGHPADVTARIIGTGLTGSAFEVRAGDIVFPVELPLPGGFNVQNALLAAAIALQGGVEPEAVAAGIAAVRPIPGRFERVDAGQDFGVVVDYAHTPEAIATVVRDSRAFVEGRLIAVAGAGGDRDQGKRHDMGRAVAGADLAVITSDNPRSEDPHAIVDAVARGARSAGGATVVEVVDRRAAIGAAIREAEAGDLVLILGKGHEQGQEIGDEVLPFDDRVVAADEIGATTGGGSAP
jgi:UDP-N-acetylmuramoyl-L-alanyl-D-glutamate--2,6-diaminopimelate ligase